MVAFLKDLRFGARALIKKPGSAIVSVVVLSLGIGLSAFMFSLVYGVVLAVICSVGFFASWIPAKRATSVDPVNALRYD